MLENENQRLRKCSSCDGDGREWDAHVKDYTIACANCAGEGTICGNCYKDIFTCDGEDVCWEQDEDELFEYTPEKDEE